MQEDLKFAIDALIAEGEWKALGIIASTFGGVIDYYIRNHEDCPW
jgi:hypothetical protein